MEVITIDRKKAIILLSVVAVVAILGSSFALTAYAVESGAEGDLMPRFCGFARGWGGRWGRFGEGHLGWIEVSEEYEENAINIAKSDLDVDKLLTEDGYSITGVKPIIKTSIDADGDVTSTATTAIIMLELESDPSSRAVVRVDLSESKVTEIVIITRTVIEKT